MLPTGPNYGSTTSQTGSGVSWTNLSNALVENGSVASCGFVGPGGGGGAPNQLNVTGLGFNLPSTAVIDGIKLEIKVQTTGGNAANGASLVSGGIYLLYSGGNTAVANTPNSGQAWPTAALTWLTFGGSTSLWGKSWTYSDINNASFGASMAAMPGSGIAQINVDSVRVTVYWHTAPTDVPKRYTYQIYSSSGTYIGTLPNVLSDFQFAQEMDTAGAQITIECGVSPDTAAQPVDNLTDESGNLLTDESNNQLTDEGQTPIVALGTGPDALIKNGNKVKVFEYSYWHPNGQQVFSGEMENWSADFGGSGEDKIAILCYSDGSDLQDYLVRGNPYTYTLDQSNTSQNNSATIIGPTNKGALATTYGQSFVTGNTVTNVGAITVKLNGMANVTINFYDSPSLTTLLGTTSQSVNVGAATDVQFAFSNSVVVSPNTSYFFTVSVDTNQSITLYYQNSNTYANGAMYTNTGGGFNINTGQDLYFLTYSGTGSTTGTYTSQDPSTGMMKPIFDDYIARGGLITYTASSIQSTGLSLSYGFNTQTILDAAQSVKSMCPNGFYWYVDIGTSIFNLKQTGTSADFIIVKGQNTQSIRIVASIESITNTTFFSGGLVSGSNIYTEYSDATSVALYGPRLNRLSDQRVTDLTTARQIAKADVLTNKSEQFQTTVTLLDSKYFDISTIKPGMVVGFAGFGSFVDSLLMQVVRLEKYPEYVTLTLGVLPKRLHPAFDKLTRGLIALQTVNNPSTPS